MTLFFGVLFAIGIVLLIMNLAHNVRHGRQLNAIIRNIEKTDAKEKIHVSPLVDKIEKVHIYKRILPGLKTEKARDLFQTLIDDEEKHIALISSLLAKQTKERGFTVDEKEYLTEALEIEKKVLSKADDCRGFYEQTGNTAMVEAMKKIAEDEKRHIISIEELLAHK